jgi:predicted aldo/keto reductase-like oxidoreductase
MDVNHHPGVGGIKYVADRGLAVVITEPLRGGRLTKVPPIPVAKVWADSGSQGRSPAEWGLGWVWNHPEVSVVVSDMSSLTQVEDNINLADNAEPDSLSVQEMVLISHVREAYNKLRPVPCTACRACMPCPVDIDVPRIFEIYNDAVIYNDIPTARAVYRMERHDMDLCTECEVCQNACAKGLDLMDYLKSARRLLTEQDVQQD